MSESSTDELDSVASGVNTGSDTGSQEADGSKPADSPAASDTDAKPASMLDAVRSALNTPKEQSSSSGDTGTGQDPEADPSDPSKEDDEEGDLEPITDEELNSYHSKTRRRFKQILREKDTAVAKATELEPLANRMQNIDRFISDNGLTRDDVNQSFEIMRLIGKEPGKALELLIPVVRDLQLIVGAVLPDDLQEQVNRGAITDEHAKELAKLRLTTQAQERQAADTQKRNQTETNQRQVAEVKAAVGTAISNWETSWKKSDPDYRNPVKYARVKEKILLELLQCEKSKTVPKNAQEAVELAERCKKAVEEELRKLGPRRSEVRQVTGVSSQPGSKPVPKTMLDVVRQAVGQ